MASSDVERKLANLRVIDAVQSYPLPLHLDGVAVDDTGWAGDVGEGRHRHDGDQDGQS